MTRMGRLRSSLLVMGSLLALLVGCSPADGPEQSPDPGPNSPRESTPGSPMGRVMPDLVGMTSPKAGDRLGRLGGRSEWGRPVVVGCETRPQTIARQRPAAGTPVRPHTIVRIRTAVLDLDRFRGPCPPHDTRVGAVAEVDAAVARRFYRFAADPSLGAPLTGDGVWVGIEDGLMETTLTGGEVTQLGAWELDGAYAERAGPFSALDTLAESGGYYEVSDGVAGTCPAGNDKAPPVLEGMRAISLTSPEDVTSACPDWWG